MGQVIAMPGERCEAVRLLLPWHAAGTLDADDREPVERHLADCAACRGELAHDHRLRAMLAADDGAGADAGWHAMTRMLDRPPPAVAAPRVARDRRRRHGPRRLLSEPRGLRRIVGVQAVALLLLATVALLPRAHDGAYRALGDTPAAAVRTGNVLAMFRPDTSERSMRRALSASHARLVDGPTAGGAYVLAVPGGAALRRLRAAPGVTMAEPIGGRAAQ